MGFCGPLSGRRISSGDSCLIDKVRKLAGKVVKNPNPDPSNFKIVKIQKVGDVFVTKLNYPDCTNYEGNKILVLKYNPQHFEQVDPHFTKSGGVIARFLPTDDGWLMAIGFAQSIAR